MRIVAVLITSLLPCALYAATQWSAQDYDLYPGDFNGDGKTDILFIAKNAGLRSGIALSDSSGPSAPWQMWSSNHLGIQWHGGLYAPVVGDFNNDGKSDVLMQRSTPGDSYLLLTDAQGRLTSIAQTIGYAHVGLAWSKDQHSLFPGDFSGDSFDDLFFQASEPSGIEALLRPDSGGRFTASPSQTFSDSSWPSFKWSRRHSVITAGDFNGDGRADLLIQAKPIIVMIDFDIAIPVPTYMPNSFGVVYSQGGAAPFQQVGVQQWSRNYAGVDWSPTSSMAIVGDFNNDGRDDVLLQAKNSSRQSYLLTGNASGAAFSAPVAVSSNITVTADGARAIAGRFGGQAAQLYVQAISATGTNYVANVSGGSIVGAAHDSAAIMTGETAHFAYDAKGRLVRTVRVGVVHGTVDTEYQYDKANNRTAVTTTGSSNPPQ